MAVRHNVAAQTGKLADVYDQAAGIVADEALVAMAAAADGGFELMIQRVLQRGDDFGLIAADDNAAGGLAGFRPAQVEAFFSVS